MNTIKRLLIANRGEIACRIMRTARGLGIKSVAIYSDADTNAPHVALADYAAHLGPAPAAESYLAIDKIIEAARQTGADAIHPGYGFLSENAAFAHACTEADIIFVGPSEHAIKVMGDKAQAKRAMIEAGVPCLSGYHGKDQSLAVLEAEAEKIGFPLMVKAAAGGGGRGMRIVYAAGELNNAIQTAKSEALNAFSADELMLEKAILRPRHVEVQIFSDAQGNFIHLGERDCSVQRRHQKVIEEAPSPVMTQDLRAAMGVAAITAARAVNYIGAGTVEFLLGQDGKFYFLEMNTRLQVEHPVTEEITGLDLVALQLRVAAGNDLGLSQDDIMLSGHAIEARLYAEDPENDFLPSTGEISFWRRPQGEGIRLDAGVTAGGEVSSHYDPIVAKVIATGANREEARRGLVAALQSSAMFGPATNRDFLIDALERGAFQDGKATTAFIDEEYGQTGFDNKADPTDICKAAAIHFELRKRAAATKALDMAPELLDWSSAAALTSAISYHDHEAQISTAASPSGKPSYAVSASGAALAVEIERLDTDTATLICDGHRERIIYHLADDATLNIATAQRQFSLREATPGDNDSAGGDGVVTAPMHGLLIEMFAEPNQHVKRGERLAILEAMKMQHEILADIDGAVTSISARAGDQIAAGARLLEIKPDP